MMHCNLHNFISSFIVLLLIIYFFLLSHSRLETIREGFVEGLLLM